MAGNHRNEEARTSSIFGIVPLAAIAVGVLLIIGFVVWTVAGGDEPTSYPDEPGAGSSTSPSSSPTPVKPGGDASPVSPIDDLPRIPGASPRRLVIDALVDAGFDNAIAADGEVLEASSSSDLSRVEERGEPGSPGKDTVIIVGEDRFDRSAALNKIAEVAKDDEIQLETSNARLTYTVQQSIQIDSSRVTQSPLFANTRPGRLILVATTYDDSGERTGTDTMIVARLSDAEAN